MKYVFKEAPAKLYFPETSGSPASIDPTFSYKIEGKERTLNLLSHKIKSYEKRNIEIEVIQFQPSSTALMLMLQYIRTSLEDLEQVLAECGKVAQ